MTLAACAELVQSQDPDRFGATLVAAPSDRPALITLYALNLEIARAPFQSAEPMLAEMRLQWWIDRLEGMGAGHPPPLHDVLTPLWDAWGPQAGKLAALAEARRRDCERQPFDSPDAVAAYVAATAGQLMVQAAGRLGAQGAALDAAADQGLGAGLAAWLRALPRLQPIGLGLAAESRSETAWLAHLACAALRRAALSRALLPKRATAALYPGPRVARFLAAVGRNDINPFLQDIDVTPFQRRASLAGLALTGRWWRHVR
ncbi:squalene/phytoene synthase family protein [uncultured Paracoccus sp.]|uniref:squalene/phytoene synthase family protein n=1 Tax=uncultured Paracoccus sp. TaxID=189685 RepID=UPI0025EAC619|nr:squalene/phytoene synthase family protein [uncultured Paracoccus sp.]